MRLLRRAWVFVAAGWERHRRTTARTPGLQRSRRSRRSLLQGLQRCLRDPCFFCDRRWFLTVRRADVQASRYEEVALLTMRRSSGGEHHDDELRLQSGRQLDNLWIAHQRQADAGVVVRLMIRLPRCHVCLAGDGLIMPSEAALGDDFLSVHNAVLQPKFVAPNFAQVDHVKVLLSDSFGYHAA